MLCLEYKFVTKDESETPTTKIINSFVMIIGPKHFNFLISKGRELEVNNLKMLHSIFAHISLTQMINS